MKTTHAALTECFTFDGVGKTRFTKDGFLVANPRIARTGIQIYGGDEVGAPEMQEVRVFRPEDEVFHQDALHSLAHKTITLDHPDDPVTADNWKKLAVGHLDGGVARDGDYIRIPMMLSDATAIKQWQNGTRQLSVGYTCDLEWTPGKTSDGKEYDAIQRNIRANHLAVVRFARGGPDLTIGDDDNGENGDTEMNTKRIMVDGMSVEVLDASAQIIERFLQTSDAKMKTLETELQTAKSKVAEVETKLAESDKQVKAKDAETVTLKKQVEDAKLKPADLDRLVKERAETISKARAILGDKLTTDGKTIPEIQKQVVLSELGDKAKGWNDEQIATSFDTLAANVDLGDEDGFEDEGMLADGDYTQQRQQRSPLRRAAAAFSSPGFVGDSVDRAYDERNSNLRDAWKPEHLRPRNNDDEGRRQRR